MITTINDKAAFLQPVGLSELGTPIIDNIRFPAGRYQELTGVLIDFPELVINDATLVITRGKRIVESVINGQPGTVKEHITADDYKINVTGTITAAIGFPAEKIQALSKIERVPDRVVIQSKMLAYFGIDYVVISNMSIQQKGSINSYPISLELLSDRDIDFSTFG